VEAHGNENDMKTIFYKQGFEGDQRKDFLSLDNGVIGIWHKDGEMCLDSSGVFLSMLNPVPYAILDVVYIDGKTHVEVERLPIYCSVSRKDFNSKWSSGIYKLPEAHYPIPESFNRDCSISEYLERHGELYEGESDPTLFLIDSRGSDYVELRISYYYI
jgi:hypothetical protein